MNKRVIFVDYENVQDISDLGKIESYDFKVLVGKNQNKIPIEIVMKIQKFGTLVEWIQVSGQGKNALDFFIAYFLGKYIELKKYEEYVVISKDGGYEPLIKYLFDLGIKASVITNVKQLIQGNKNNIPIEEFNDLVENIIKIPMNKRPKKRNSLIAHLETSFKNKKSKEKIIELVEEMFAKKYLIEIDGIIKYSDKKS